MAQRSGSNQSQSLLDSLVERRPTLALVVCNIGLAGSYWATGVFVRWYFSKYQMWPAPLWIPAAIALFAALLLGWRCAPGILAGSLLTNFLSFHVAAATGLLVALGNTLGPVATIALVRKHLRLRDPFSEPRDVFWFTASCILSGTITGVVGITGYQIGNWISFQDWVAGCVSWMLSDASASLLLVPLFAFMVDSPPTWGRLSKHSWEGVATVAMAGSAVLYLLARSSGHLAVDAGSSFLILIPLLWAAVRVSPRFAYPLFVLVMAFLVVGTLSGYGPYAAAGQPGKFLVLAQMTLGFGTSVLLLGAVSNQHRVALRALRNLNEDLEVRIETRTSELRESKKKLEQIAFHDPLTGLPNRRFLEDRFASVLAACERKKGKFSLLLIDLDHFKRINDTLGHDAGDVLLIEASRKISAAVRTYDFVARLGGDEFAVLLPDVAEPEQVDPICKRIIGSFFRAITFNGKVLETSSSLGVAVFPDDGTNWYELYKSADLALYSAKQNGRNRFYRHQQSAAGQTANVEGDAPGAAKDAVAHRVDAVHEGSSV